MEVRAPSELEAAAVAELLNAHEGELHGSASVTPDEVRHWWAVQVDRATGVRVAGEPLEGYADLHQQASAWWADVRCVSDDAATALVDWAETAAGRPLRVFTSSKDSRVAELLRRRGYRHVRSSFRMSLELEGAAVPAPEWPEGVVLRTCGVGEERAVYDAHTEAFTGQWDFAPDPYDQWVRRHRDGPRHDPELWFLALDGEEIAGFALCERAPSNEVDHGWVGELGVRPGWRRRGLALALLYHAFSAFAARGYRRVSLGVDAENPTGAVGLYERAGMHVVRRNDTYELGG